MRPVPYVNPIGYIDQLTQEGSGFTFDNPEGFDALTVGARVAVLRHCVETGAVVKVQGTVSRGPGRGQVRRHRALGQPGGPAQGRECRRDRTILARQPEHRVQVLGPGWKRRTKAEAHQPAAGVAAAARP